MKLADVRQGRGAPVVTVSDLLLLCAALVQDGRGDMPVVVRVGKRPEHGAVAVDAAPADGREYPWFDEALRKRDDDHLLLEVR